MTRSHKNVMADPFWVEKRRGYIMLVFGVCSTIIHMGPIRPFFKDGSGLH